VRVLAQEIIVVYCPLLVTVREPLCAAGLTISTHWSLAGWTGPARVWVAWLAGEDKAVPSPSFPLSHSLLLLP
jgi:hypothetical protein